MSEPTQESTEMVACYGEWWVKYPRDLAFCLDNQHKGKIKKLQAERDEARAVAATWTHAEDAWQDKVIALETENAKLREALGDSNDMLETALECIDTSSPLTIVTVAAVTRCMEIHRALLQSGDKEVPSD